MTRRLLVAAAIFGFISVAFGALGAHKLREIISDDNLRIFEKGVQYQFYHSFAIISAALLLEHFGQKNFYYAGMLFIGGIICFSGSLYLLALREIQITNTISMSEIFPATIIGPVTPIGGLLLLAGWATMFFAILKLRK